MQIDGDVIDVSSNRRTYGPGGPYHHMWVYIMPTLTCPHVFAGPEWMQLDHLVQDALPLTGLTIYEVCPTMSSGSVRLPALSSFTELTRCTHVGRRTLEEVL